MQTENDRATLSWSYLEGRLQALDAHIVEIQAIGLESDLSDLVRRYLEQCAALDAAWEQDPDEEALPSLLRLRRRFGLSVFDDQVLLLALAPTLDSRFGERVAALKRVYGRTTPDVGLALSLFAATFAERVRCRGAFSPKAALLRNHLLQLDARSAHDGNLLEMGLHLPVRIANLLLENDSVEASLEGFSRLLWPKTDLDDVVLPKRMLGQIMAVAGQYELYLQRRAEWGHQPGGDGGRSIVLLFSGAPGTGKTLMAHALAHYLGRPLLLVDANRLQSARGVEANMDHLLREARLQRAVLLFDDCESLFASRLQGNRDLPTLLAALDAYEGIVLLTTNLPTLLDTALERRITLTLEFDILPPRLREEIWRLHIPPKTPLAADVDLPLLADKYEFSGGHIRNSVVVALNRALARVDEPSPSVTMQDFEESARTQIRHRLKNLADKTLTHLTLEDLILPKEIKAKLYAIIAAVRNRRVIFEEWGFGEKLTTGKGLCVLFRGESGTGKTLAAEILANELAMTLYRVRIPAIVSKYVGETEKNLEKCFREAAAAGAILLFDEADSIFSKRTEVNSANDRYANMEVNLLLQEVERFEGMVILTTNLDAAIDDAFERRLNSKIDFPFPDNKARARIWRHLIPNEAPLGPNVSFDFLGEDFELSGGCIKNAVIRAAYAAAERKSRITMDLLEAAGEQEYREMGKLVPNRRNPWD